MAAPLNCLFDGCSHAGHVESIGRGLLYSEQVCSRGARVCKHLALCFGAKTACAAFVESLVCPCREQYHGTWVGKFLGNSPSAPSAQTTAEQYDAGNSGTVMGVDTSLVTTVFLEGD